MLGSMTATDPDLTPLGELFETARQAKRPKLSQNAVAKAARTSSTTYRRVIAGVSRFGGQDIPFEGSAETVARIALVLGVTPEQLEEVGRAEVAQELRLLREGEPAARDRQVEQAEADLDNARHSAHRAAEDADDPRMQRAMELLAEATAVLEQIRAERRKGA